MRISQIKFPVASRKWQRFASNAYVQHSELAACFEGDERFLFRMEPQGLDGMGVLLVQSHLEPRWDASDMFQELPMDLRLSKEFELAFESGMDLRFRLRANPTVKREGKRHAVTGEEQLAAWANRKFEAIGTQVTSLLIIPEGFAHATRPKTGGSRRMTFASVRFEGTLRVESPKELQRGVVLGVGSAKAFGFGLLSLARG